MSYPPAASIASARQLMAIELRHFCNRIMLDTGNRAGASLRLAPQPPVTPISSFSDPESDGPIPIRDSRPFNLLFLQFTPESGDVLTKNSNRYDLQLDVINNLQIPAAWETDSTLHRGQRIPEAAICVEARTAARYRVCHVCAARMAERRHVGRHHLRLPPSGRAGR